jgi:hypothetical protein
VFIRDKDSKFNHRVVLGLLLYCVIPALDVLTDLVYILQSRFFSVVVFTLTLFFFVLPTFQLFKLLLSRGIFAKFWILPMPECLFFASYDNIFKIAFTGLASIPFLIVNLPVLLPVCLAGATLYRYLSTYLYFIIDHYSNYY